MTESLTLDFQKVNASSTISGRIRTAAEDFQVDEIQQFTPSGIGEHVWLHIKKTGENTDWVAAELAKIAGVPRRDVSYAGMKDRNAVTTQWFSVQMPGKEAPDWKADLPVSIQILEEKRHDKKLRRGALLGNQFKLIIRDFSGDQSELDETISRITEQGVPNYFGAQRFGNYCFNVIRAEKWFKGEFKLKDRAKRSIYLSAARSWIFNHILSARVTDGTWNKAIEGDVFMLKDSNSFFLGMVNDEIIKRVNNQEINPSGALWGRGRLPTQGAIAGLEQDIASQFAVLCEGLEKNGLKQERRSLRLNVNDLSCEKLEDGILSLNFSLPTGTYATTVLEEIGTFTS
jgi:tRNA pseudouridine13 synthase